MNLFGSLPPAQYLHPSLNLGCLYDIPTGSYFEGEAGESVLSGGMQFSTGVGGRANMGKSTIAHHQHLTAQYRYGTHLPEVVKSVIYDSEIPSVSPKRLNHLYSQIAYAESEDIIENGRLFLTDGSVVSGNVFWDTMKKQMMAKSDKENVKKYTGTTPFIDPRTKEAIKILYPTFNEIDSFSMMPIDTVEDMQEENEIGSSGMNMESMKWSGAKSQMITQMTNLPARMGGYFLLTAHVDDEIQMDPRSIPQKKLSYLKNKTKFKQVPRNFLFIMNNLWYLFSTESLQNDTTKSVEFPKNSDDNLKGDTDLQKAFIINLRGKNGPSGMQYEMIFSQRDGVLPSLTEFNYLKTIGNRFGLGGNIQNYFLDFYDSAKLSRTAIRGKLDEDYKLRRAMEITSELCQIVLMKRDLYQDLLCDPATLLADLTKMGYDRDEILETRGYWQFKEANHPRKFLSTLDLLRMRKGLYKPYWQQ